MSREASPITSEHIPLENLEFAGALQATLSKTKDGQNFRLDVAQETAIEMIGAALLEGKTSGYVEMATGTGKTAIEVLVADAAVRAGKRVLLLAPKIAIARQIVGSDHLEPTGIARFTNLADTATIGKHFGNSRAQAEDQVVVSTYSGFLQENKTDNSHLGKFDVILADECHRSLGERTATAMRESFPDAIKIGFSATPDFAADRMSSEVFDTKLFEFSLADAIESGKTAPLRVLIYETEQLLELVDARQEFTEKELAPLVENSSRNGTALDLARSLTSDNRQGIIACIPGGRNIHARIMADILSRDGIVAADIGAHLTIEDQQERLQLFQDGAIDVLTFTRALEEGWDSSKANFCINMAPTASPVRTKQLLGRVLRQNDDSRESIYVDFVDATNGVSKQQYTAHHALNLETIDINRVLGSSSKGSKWSQGAITNLPQLPEKLLEQIWSRNGSLVSDLTVTKTEKADPLTLHWEGILASEGMPAEVAYNEMLPERFYSDYQKAARRLRAHEGFDASHEEILDELRTNTAEYVRRAVGNFGIKLTLDEVDDTLISLPSDYDDIHNEVTQRELQTVVGELLALELTDLQRSVIEERFGFRNPNQAEATLRETGHIVGKTPEYVRQIQSKATSILRHPNRSEKVIDYSDSAATSLRSNQLLRERARLSKEYLRELNIRRYNSSRIAPAPHEAEKLSPEAAELSPKVKQFLDTFIDYFESSKRIRHYIVNPGAAKHASTRDLKQLFGMPVEGGSYSDSDLIWTTEDPWYRVATGIRHRLLTSQNGIEYRLSGVQAISELIDRAVEVAVPK